MKKTNPCSFISEKFFISIFQGWKLLECGSYAPLVNKTQALRSEVVMQDKRIFINNKNMRPHD